MRRALIWGGFAFSFILLLAATLSFVPTAVWTQNTVNDAKQQLNTLYHPNPGGTGTTGASVTGPKVTVGVCPPAPVPCDIPYYLCSDTKVFYSCDTLSGSWVQETDISTAVGASGGMGSTGGSGSTGTLGATGATGESGLSGTTGANGSNGATGQDGATGATGATGAAGNSQLTGGVGSNGGDGVSGSTGASGASGSSGGSGFSGASGPTGGTPNNIHYAKNIQVGWSGDTGCPTIASTNDLQAFTFYFSNVPEYCGGWPAGFLRAAFIDATYDAVLNKWVVLGTTTNEGGARNGTFTTYSFDGYTWAYSPIMNINLTNPLFLTWDAGKFLAGGATANGNELLWTSLDGVNFGPVAGGTNLNALGVTVTRKAAYSNDDGHWLMVVTGPSSNSSIIAASSLALNTWSIVMTVSTFSFNNVCYGHDVGIWMVVGTSYVGISTTGYAGPYTAFTGPNIAGLDFAACAYGNGFFMLIAGDQVFRNVAGTFTILDIVYITVPNFLAVSDIEFSRDLHTWSVSTVNPFLLITLTSVFSQDFNGSSWQAFFGAGGNFANAFTRSA
jgi:hypothetical protein